MSEREPLSRRVLGWPGRLNRGWGALATATLGVLATGLGDLVLADIVPNQGARIVLLVIALLLFAWLFYSGSWQRRQAGTLFYLRMLPHGQPDWHSDLAARYGMVRTSFRSLLRRFQLGVDTCPDISIDVETFSDRVAELVHRDDPNTTTTVAPNLSFPVALAVGYNWNQTDDVVLFDIDRRMPDAERLIFDMGGVRRAWANGPASLPGVRRDDRPAGGAADLVFLQVYLSDQAAVGLDSVPAGFRRPGTVSTIGIPTGSGKFGAVVAGSTAGQHDAAAIAAYVAHQILTTIRADKLVVLLARLPKTVALAVGALLREGADSRTDVWGHLATVLYVVGDDRPYRPVVVNARQPAAERYLDVCDGT